MEVARNTHQPVWFGTVIKPFGPRAFPDYQEERTPGGERQHGQASSNLGAPEAMLNTPFRPAIMLHRSIDLFFLHISYNGILRPSLLPLRSRSVLLS